MNENMLKFTNSIISIKKFKLKMRWVSSTKKIIKFFDFFFSTVQLRYQQQLQYKTVTGGFFSLAILITIVVGFASMILNMFELNTYTVTEEIEKQRIPTLATLSTNQSQSRFMFGIEIIYLNLSDTRRYFDVSLTHQILNYGNMTANDYIPLLPCTRQHWQHYPQLLQAFDQLRVGGWLCPPMNINLDIQGKFSSQRFSQYQIKVKACSNSTDPSRPCHSPQDIQQLYQTYSSVIYFTVYFINPILNQNRKDFLDYYLEDINYSIFGKDIGTQNYLLFTDYTVNTDKSIWPFPEEVKEQDCVVQNQASKYSFQSNPDNGTFILFFLAKSSNSLTINRVALKISQVFSFIGGSIGALLTLLFIIKQYTNFSFQIALAYNIFQRQKPKEDLTKSQCIQLQQNHNNQKNTEQINFTYYFSFALYKVLKFFGQQVKWKQMNYIEKCEQQIAVQLDIKNLVSRIIFLQFCITYMFEDYQLEGLQLKRPKTAEQIKQIRQKSQSISNSTQQAHQNKQVRSIQPKSRLKQIHEQSSQTNKQCIQQAIKMYFDAPSINKQGNINNRDLIEQIKVESVNSENWDKEIGDMESNGKVNNVFQLQGREGELLTKLRQNAKRGDNLSKKIWKKVTESHKK